MGGVGDPAHVAVHHRDPWEVRVRLAVAAEHKQAHDIVLQPAACPKMASLLLDHMSHKSSKSRATEPPHTPFATRKTHPWLIVTIAIASFP
jgi:hypothetical protein